MLRESKVLAYDAGGEKRKGLECPSNFPRPPSYRFSATVTNIDHAFAAVHHRNPLPTTSDSQITNRTFFGLQVV